MKIMTKYLFIIIISCLIVNINFSSLYAGQKIVIDNNNAPSAINKKKLKKIPRQSQDQEIEVDRQTGGIKKHRAPIIRAFRLGGEYWRPAYMSGGTGTVRTLSNTVDFEVYDKTGIKYIEIKFRGTRIYYKSNGLGTTFRRHEILELSTLMPSVSGAYPVELITADRDNRISRKTISTKVDVAPCVVNITQPVGDRVFRTIGNARTANVIINVNVTDAFSGVENVILFVTKRNEAGIYSEQTSETRAFYANILRSPFSYSHTAPLPVGEYRCIINHSDNAGHHPGTRFDFSVVQTGIARPAS